MQPFTDISLFTNNKTAWECQLENTHTHTHMLELNSAPAYLQDIQFTNTYFHSKRAVNLEKNGFTL